MSSSTYLLREVTKDLEGFGSRKIRALEVWKNVWVAAWLSRKSLADNPTSETPFEKLRSFKHQALPTLPTPPLSKPPKPELGSQ